MIVLPMSFKKIVTIEGKTIDLLLDKSGLITNSFGQVKISNSRERENIIYRAWDIQFSKTTLAEDRTNSGRDEVQIMFNLNQDIKWEIKKSKVKDKDIIFTGSENVEMAKGEVCIFRNKRYSTAMKYQAGQSICIKTLQMPTSYFQFLLSKYFSDQTILELEDQLLTKVTKTNITPEMNRVLSEIDTADRFKEYEGVYTEGKMIELTALVLYGIAYQKTDEIKRLPLPQKEDAERIELLREKIQTLPDLDYNAQRVACELGMSISKLNRLFRCLYATTLHNYVQEMRLEYAAKLLKENKLPISEAALKSGYTNMSHFSKSFYKKFGILPKDY